jgi:hypothetical protein
MGLEISVAEVGKPAWSTLESITRGPRDRVLHLFQFFLFNNLSQNLLLVSGHVARLVSEL